MKTSLLFIKKNLKIILFIVIFLFMIIGFTLFINRELSYSVEYDLNDFHIIENYNKDSKMYSFKLSSENYNYDFSINHKYSRKRKIINNINSFDRDNYKCVSINVYNIDTNTICNYQDDYYDNNIINVDNGNEFNKGDFTIYNDNYDYLVWSDKGFINKRDESKYEFLNNESYTNDLSYQFGDYIIIADYDSKRSFSKFYIYNKKKKKIIAWDTKQNISFDSYFMGNINDDLYLFDKTNKVQYRMNIDKKKIKKSNKNGKAVFYDNGITNIDINKLLYDKVLFNNDKLYNYEIKNDKLYYRYYKSDKLIRISDLNIKSIVTIDNNSVYYISDTSLYKYDPVDGNHLLAKYFEWNFDYLNKIYVFSR